MCPGIQKKKQNNKNSLIIVRSNKSVGDQLCTSKSLMRLLEENQSEYSYTTIACILIVVTGETCFKDGNFLHRVD